MFVDRVQLQLSAGKGGNGVISWRREKYIPKGGPAGGDGGKGASIFFEADPKIPSLEDFRNRRIVKAAKGMPGGSNNCKGKDGKDLVLKVPLGTLIKNGDTILCDLTQPGQRYLACRGGRGGLGNSRFKSATHQAPYRCTDGTEGEAREVELELKLIADIGLIGMPNAGKSTLISRLSRVHVKIAPYPFTTLRPNLGIVEFDDYSRLLIADIPGLIERASQNRGLGIAFLKHIERTSRLLFLIELSPFEESRDPFQEFLMLRQELFAYNPALLDKPFLVALNKIDLDNTAPLAKAFASQYPYDPATLFVISAEEGLNLTALKEAIHTLALPCPL